MKQEKQKHSHLPVTCRFVNDVWCLDLTQVDKLAESNSEAKVLMVTIDVFTRFIRVGPMRNKSADAATACFIRLFFQPST